MTDTYTRTLKETSEIDGTRLVSSSIIIIRILCWLAPTKSPQSFANAAYVTTVTNEVVTDIFESLLALYKDLTVRAKSCVETRVQRELGACMRVNYRNNKRKKMITYDM